MPIDFKYVPPSPEPISGPSFIHQTEQAINELGGLADDAQSAANQALLDAQNAQNTASTALSTAQNAQTSADNAQFTADGAQTTASAAQNTAATAQLTANNAYDLAAIADSKADNAQTSANLANQTADTGRANAQTAQETAEAAQVTASAAMSVAQQAMGIYQTYDTDDADALDLDNLYTSPVRFHVIGSGQAVNLPDGVELPVYFDVRIDDNNTTAWQTVTLEGGTQVWTRMAEVTKDLDGEGEDSVVWTAWEQSGGNGTIAAVGKPGLMAPDGVNTFVDPATGILTLTADIPSSAAIDALAETAIARRYGTCTTAVGTVAKVASVAGFVRKTGSIVGVKFTHANTAASPTLNVNNTGAAPIFVNGEPTTGTDGAIVAGMVALFQFDGTNWNLLNPNMKDVDFGTCTTAAGTTAKVGTLPGFVRRVGGLVVITFTNANTANKPTLNVNSTGAAAIQVNGTNLTSTDGLISAGMVALFQFDGTYWNLLNPNTIVQNIPTIRAWVHCAADGSIRASYNITSVTRTGTGAYTIVSPGITSTTTSLFLGMHTAHHRGFFWLEPRTVGSVKIYFTGTNVNASNADFNLVILG